jgi:hypothetical protein
VDVALCTAVDAENPIEGDLMLVAGDLASVVGKEAIAQHVRVRLRFFCGEWFLDLREGVPWWESILIKNPSTRVVEALLRKTILDTPGIASLPAFELAVDTATRAASVSFTAVTDEGEALVFDAFVLSEAP